MRIAMIGTGYVGLVSGACFSDFGHDVTCVDKDEGKIEALARGEMPIFEPGLGALVERNVRGGRLAFSTDLEEGVGGRHEEHRHARHRSAQPRLGGVRRGARLGRGGGSGIGHDVLQGSPR